MEDDAAGEDAMDHTGQPATRERSVYVPLRRGMTYNEMTKRRSGFPGQLSESKRIQIQRRS